MNGAEESKVTLISLAAFRRVNFGSNQYIFKITARTARFGFCRTVTDTSKRTQRLGKEEFVTSSGLGFQFQI